MTVGRSAMVVALLLSAGCVLPQDVSDQLAVEFTPVTGISLVGDTVDIAARLLNASRAEMPNAELDLQVSNDVIAQVLERGPRSLRLLLRSAGSVTVTATATQYHARPSASLTLLARPAVAIDSVRPTSARFGDTLSVYGVGLDTTGLLGLFAGNRTLPVRGYEAADPAQPQRVGRLTAWMAPGAPPRGVLSVATLGGAASGTDSVSVSPQDIYEPNDSVPWLLSLGPGDFLNPALALEGRSRDDTRPTVDWYRVATTAGEDLTVQWMVPRGRLYAAMVSDTIVDWYDTYGATGAPRWQIWVSPDYVFDDCRGEWQAVAYASDTVPVTLRLPPHRFEVQVYYRSSPSDVGYGLALNRSLVTTIAPDAYESNDACDYATPLPMDGSTLQLSIDRPVDFDWFGFSVAGAGDSLNFDAEFAQRNDIDLAFYESYLPDSVVYLGSLESADPHQEVGYALLGPGNYLVLAFSYAATATPYTLTTDRTALGVQVPRIVAAARPAAAKAVRRVAAVSRALARARAE